MKTPSLTERRVSKIARIKSAPRREQILALQVAGLTQDQIAAKLGVDRRTIVRDLVKLKESTGNLEEILTKGQTRLREIYPIEKRIEKYVDHGKHAKNEAVSFAALQRLDDIDGLVTDKERLRAKGHDQPQSQPMFSLPAGAQVNVTVTTTGSRVMPDNGASGQVINVTPEESKG